MRDRSTPRYSFICLRRLRSTAMWVIRWLSASSMFFTLLALRRFLLPAAPDAAAAPSAPSASPRSPPCPGSGRARKEELPSGTSVLGIITEALATAAPQWALLPSNSMPPPCPWPFPPQTPPSSPTPSAAMAQRPKNPFENTTASNAMRARLDQEIDEDAASHAEERCLTT